MKVGAVFLTLLTLLTLLALLGCTPPAEPPPMPPRAEGSEASQAYQIKGEARANWGPGWRAVIIGSKLLLDSPTSAGWYEMDFPAAPQKRIQGTYRLGGLTFSVEPGGCAVPELQTRLPDGVALDWDAGTFRGCGGPRRPPGLISGSSWKLVRIDRDGAPDSRSPTILTMGSGGTVYGTLACNDASVGTKWRLDGRFVAAPNEDGVMSTAMGCNQPEAEAFSARFWGLVGQAERWRREGERLIITARDGREAELRFLLG